jgi:sortase (surface protein transpeptidase)
MYHLISTILFVAAILFFIFYIDEIGLFVGVISLLVVFIGSAKIGHKLAYKEYRKIIKELMNDSSDPKEKEEFEEQLKKTDSELLERVTDRLKYKI